MTRPLTEAEAWRLVAEHLLETGRTAMLWCTGVVTGRQCGLALKMEGRLYRHRYTLGGVDGVEGSVLAALWLALEAEAEGC